MTADAASAPDAPHARFFSAGQARAVDEHDRTLWDVLEGLTQGGKRFRPALLTRLYAALGGQEPAVAARVADAVELLHTAFVIHDDVIDGDDIRRGRANVNGTFTARATAEGVRPDRARRYGEAAGILAGDLALAGAVREVALCGARPDVVVRLLDLLEDVLHRSAAGELADVRVSLMGDTTVDEALDVAEWKTAAYSFQLPLQAAAILADAPDDVVAALGDVGRALGTAFQLRDDLDGVFGTVERTGKDPLCDLREGKGTALVALARTSPLWPQLAHYVGDPRLTPAGASIACELLEASGARCAVEELIDDLHDEAIRASGRLPSSAVDALTGMGDLLAPESQSPSRVQGVA